MPGGGAQVQIDLREKGIDQFFYHQALLQVFEPEIGMGRLNDRKKAVQNFYHPLKMAGPEPRFECRIKRVQI